MNNSKRIEWIDIYKAIGIFLVVVGHATGKYNAYIYQFHMAAFFAISGYCTNLQKGGFGHYFYKKCYSLYIPIVSLTILGAAMFSVLNMTHLYPLLYDTDTYPYLGFVPIIKAFLVSCDNYVWWLGAAWFICVLFQVELLHKLLYSVNYILKGNYWIYALLSFGLYVLGYYCVKAGICRERMLDLTLIGQFYFFLGQLLKRYNKSEKLFKTHWLYVIGAAASFAWLYLCQKYFAAIVDFPSRQFGNLFLNMVSGAAGSVLLWSIASLISGTHFKLKVPLSFMGANTFGILVFHFLVFKLIYLIMFFKNIVPQSYIQNITPDQNLGDSLWLVISLCAIIVSMLLWCGLQKIPFIRFAFGDRTFWESKWNQLGRYIEKNFKYEYEESLRLIGDLKNYYFIKRKNIFAGLVIMGILVSGYMLNTWINRIEPLVIEFPYQDEQLVKFEGGWQRQGEDEDYRWICGEGTIELETQKWNSLSVMGYVPETFSEVSSVGLLINGNKVCETSLPEDGSLQLYTDYIKNLAAGEKMKITIVFDGVHIHQAESADVRDLSGLINRIEFN